MKVDEGFYFSNDDILWDPNENYHNADARRKKTAELVDGDETTQAIKMEADGNATGAITGAVEMIDRRDSESNDNDNGPRIHDVFHALVASDEVGDGDGILPQTGFQTNNIAMQDNAALPQDGYMNMGYQYGMMLPAQPMVQNDDMLTAGNDGDVDGDNMNNGLLPPQPQVNNQTPQGLPDQRHAIFHQMVALNEAHDHEDLVQRLIDKQNQQIQQIQQQQPFLQQQEQPLLQQQEQQLLQQEPQAYQLPQQPKVDSNFTPGYIPPAFSDQVERQGGRLMSFGGSDQNNNNDNNDNPGN